MPGWGTENIRPSSSTPNDSILKTRIILRRSGSALALQRASNRSAVTGDADWNRGSSLADKGVTQSISIYFDILPEVSRESNYIEID